jgi:hypothetical protein
MFYHWEKCLCGIFICILTFLALQSGGVEVLEAAKPVTIYTEGGTWADFQPVLHA